MQFMIVDNGLLFWATLYTFSVLPGL